MRAHASWISDALRTQLAVLGIGLVIICPLLDRLTLELHHDLPAELSVGLMIALLLPLPSLGAMMVRVARRLPVPVVAVAAVLLCSVPGLLTWPVVMRAVANSSSYACAMSISMCL
jgi:hypothetical protein